MKWVILWGVLVLALIVGAVTWEWYVSGLQAAVYRSQGIVISQWDVFIGVHPAPALQKPR